MADRTGAGRVLPLFPLLWVLLGGAAAPLDPAAYQPISQCVLVRERAALADQQVQITGTYLEGSPFCHVLRRAGIHTRDYLCFALGSPCILRLYLHRDHPQAPLLRSLADGDRLTAYGVFHYEGTDYNYLVLDGISVER